MSVKGIVDINLPGSKSYTNRALIIAALAQGRSRLFGFAECEDSQYMVRALRSLNVKYQMSNFKTTSQNSKLKKIQRCLEIEGGINRLRLPVGEIYVENAGTVMRFLVTLLGLIINLKSQNSNFKTTSQNSKLKEFQREFVLTGSKRMCQRPIGDLLYTLKLLGIKAESFKGNGCPPVKFLISNFKFLNKSQIPNLKYQTGGQTQLKGDVSSQYLSSILLCAPYFECDTEIKIIGELTSKPYVDMTIEVMNKFGVQVVNQDYKIFRVKAGQRYQPQDYKIEPDASAASYFIAGAALTGQAVKFSGLPLTSRQGDVGFATMVAKCQMSNVKCQNYISNLKSKKDRYLEFCGSGELRGISADMNSMPDMVPTLAVLAMFAKGRTVIKNVANLRIKETDRLRALAREIGKFGIKVREFDDGLEIVGNTKIRNWEIGKLRNLRIKTYNDHRIAMAFAVAKLLIPDIIIENPDCVSKSFPWFWEEWRKLMKHVT